MRHLAPSLRPLLQRITPANRTYATKMQASSRFRVALNEGRQTLGMWQMVPGANVSRLLARTGVDWVLVDCEHGNMDGLLPPDTWVGEGRIGI